jgi:tetratricopeptide (TPR) repeat protein
VSPASSLLRLIRMDERQRMVPTDPAALAEAVARLVARAAAARAAGDAGGELSPLRSAGVGLVVLGRYEQARERLFRARDLAVGLGRDSALAACEVNLGDAFRYAGDPTAATPHYRAAVALGRTRAPAVLGFALHHLGKHLAERGERAAALECLTEALGLRRADGDPELVESTERALRLAHALPAA